MGADAQNIFPSKSPKSQSKWKRKLSQEICNKLWGLQQELEISQTGKPLSRAGSTTYIDFKKYKQSFDRIWKVLIAMDGASGWCKCIVVKTEQKMIKSAPRSFMVPSYDSRAT